MIAHAMPNIRWGSLAAAMLVCPQAPVASKRPLLAVDATNSHQSSALSGRNNMTIAPLATAATFGFVALLAQSAAAMAAEVKVMAGAGMRGAFAELVPQFERATGHKILIQYGGGATIKKQIEAGEAFDLVIIDSAEVDDLIKQGKIGADTESA
jgi:hypothetical protein